MLLGLVLAPRAAEAACTKSPFLQQRLQFSISTEAALAAYNRGLSYYNAGCLQEALGELQRAVHLLETESNPGTQRKELLGLSRAAIDLVKAQLFLEQGQKQNGTVALFTVFDRYGPSVVTLRALLALTPLLPPRAPEWSRLEADLETLSNIGYWQATKAIAASRIATGKAAAAVSYLQSQLHSLEDLQRAHALRVLLADAYRASGRTLEAWLLIREEERAGAEEILDWQLRVELLRVAAAVAQERAAEGDADASAAAAVYAAALREVGTP